MKHAHAVSVTSSAAPVRLVAAHYRLAAAAEVRPLARGWLLLGGGLFSLGLGLGIMSKMVRFEI